MTKSIIVAIGREREIGVGNTIPWDLPEDRKRFKEITEGHTVIMGRKTYESIIEALGKPLPQRKNIIVTSDQDFQALPGCIVVHSVEEALATAGQNEKVFIIGGATIYEQTLHLVEKLYLTQVEGTYPEADTFFPKFDKDEWRLVQEIPANPSIPNATDYRFLVYERKKQDSQS